MNATWRTLSGKHDRLTLRERGLVLLSVLAVIYLLWDFLLFNALADARMDAQAKLAEVKQASAAMGQEEMILREALGSDPHQDLKLQMRELEGRLAGLDENLAALSVGLVPAERLAGILQEVLAQTGALQLHKLQTLPVEELKLNVKTGAEKNRAGVYKHSVSITVKGSYFQVLDYLKALEGMSWRFHWDELRYEQGHYPTGLFELRVYTLSTEEGLFGV